MTMLRRSEVSEPINRGKHVFAGSCIDHPVRQSADHAPIGGAVPLAMRRPDVASYFFEMPRVEEPQAVPAALRDQPELTSKDGINRGKSAR